MDNDQRKKAIGTIEVLLKAGNMDGAKLKAVFDRAEEILIPCLDSGSQPNEEDTAELIGMGWMIFRQVVSDLNLAAYAAHELLQYKQNEVHQ